MTRSSLFPWQASTLKLHRLLEESLFPGGRQEEEAPDGGKPTDLEWRAAQSGLEQSGAFQARLDKRLLSYLVVYMAWSVALVPIFLYLDPAIRPHLSPDGVAPAFYTFAAFFPLQGLTNLHALPEEVCRHLVGIPF